MVNARVACRGAKAAAYMVRSDYTKGRTVCVPQPQHLLRMSPTATSTFGHCLLIGVSSLSFP